jgi:hypothetical protein
MRRRARFGGALYDDLRGGALEFVGGGSSWRAGGSGREGRGRGRERGGGRRRLGCRRRLVSPRM